MRLEFDEQGYVCCILYGCFTGACVEYTGTVPTQPEEYKDIDDWANRAQTCMYYLNNEGNLTYDAEKAANAQPDVMHDCPGSYSTQEYFTGYYWVDGKRIYKRTFPCEIATANANVVIGTIEDIDALVDCSGYLRIASSGTIVPVNRTLYASSSNITAFYFSITSDGDITARTYGSSQTGSGFITLFYTKKTT